MASLHRQHGKPFWYCAFTDHVGKRHFKSTKQTAKPEAKAVCDAMERAVRLAAGGTLNQEKARRVVEDVIAELMEISGEKVQRYATKEFLENWVNERQGEIGESTFASFQVYLKSFLAFLGPKTQQDLTALTIRDFQDFRDALKAKFSTGTVNNYMKMLRVALDDAMRRNLIDKNPAKLVKNLARTDKQDRRPFTIPELKLLLAAADHEWKTAIMLGLYTGQRISDIKRLTWENLDLQARELTIARTEKTDRVVAIPIARPLLRHLETLSAGDDSKAPLCPSLARRPSSELSNLFYTLMFKAGLVESRKKRWTGKKRETTLKREMLDISFHSLRHTATTLLKRAGVNDAVAKDIIGHDSEAASRAYTHIDSETKRLALEKLPDITVATAADLSRCGEIT